MQVQGFNADLGRQQFLDLLVTQLQYQDPLEPVGQQEFIQQLAQFSVVEGVEQLNSQFSEMLNLQTLTDGASFIDQNVEYLSPATGLVESGTVTEARVVEGKLALTVNGETVSASDIQALLSHVEA
ncbi:flagellar hook capping FlgD N-terminal domain-containing protein [Thalassoglobus sp. JC818]|uniref:flagellar hook assembly protein FlgD n=1 Tax=Thalassoglobus sp. JC818 TaxID=3232136 RepID=UPI003457EC91